MCGHEKDERTEKRREEQKVCGESVRGEFFFGAKPKVIPLRLHFLSLCTLSLLLNRYVRLMSCLGRSGRTEQAVAIKKTSYSGEKRRGEDLCHLCGIIVFTLCSLCVCFVFALCCLCVYLVLALRSSCVSFTFALCLFPSFLPGSLVSFVPFYVV